MNLYLGIDIGTGSCKTSIINQSGHVLGIGSNKYSSHNEAQNLKEQNPTAILTGMISAVKQVIQKVEPPDKAIKALSIGCALHGSMAIDEDGIPLTHLFTWADGRAAPQANKMKESQWFQDLYQQTGCPAHGMYPLYKIIRLREEFPQVFSKAARFISAKEYILSKLCHEEIVDFSIASGTGLFNIHTHQWNPLSLELAQISDSHLSTVADPRTILNIKNNGLADEMGISLDTLVTLGSSDAANSNLGAGAVTDQQATCMIGTSGAYRIISSRPLLDPNAGSWCYAVDEDHWLVGGAINNGGLAFSWLKDTLQSATKEEIRFENLLELAENCPAGSNGLLCLPFFAGERSPNWNLDARAMFFGLSVEHNASHLARSVLEGIAFRLKNLDEMLTHMDTNIKEVRASGGYTHSDFWIQLVSNVLDKPISVPREGETSCLGAAFWAYTSQNPSTSLKDLSSLVEISKEFSPQSETQQTYAQLYSLFQDLYQSVSPLFKQISELQAPNL